jgi:adenine-specific DNA-methyltransferase
MSEDIFETPSSTPNFQTELASQLADLVPEAIADGKIDVIKLQELLAQDAADTTERFGLFWPGKRLALQVAQSPTKATLKPMFSESQNWDTTENVYLEGDNLQALKVLQKHYHGKIKMIYIDPPYNTGKDFVYKDNFVSGISSYLEWSSQVSDAGKPLASNSESDGRYHSNWLNMLYPRLKLARNLLTEDGAIFISIDDHEVDNLRRLCAEVFGESNFISQLVWQNRVSPANDATWFSSDHEYVLVYAKRASSWSPNRLDRTEKQNSYYKNPDNDLRGPWNSAAYTCNKNSDERPNLYYPIINPHTGEEVWPKKTAVWAYSKETHEENVRNNLLYWGADGKSASPRKKTFLTEVGKVVPRSFLGHNEVGSTQSSTLDFLKIFEHNYFQYTKPVGLIKRLIQYGTSDGDLILDFFSGSGTTAHATMALNAEEATNRRYILVQLPEPISPDSQAGRDGYRSIPEIARERIRRASNGIAESQGLLSHELDFGFRAYSLSDTNFTKWSETSEVTPSDLEAHLFDSKDSAADSTSQDDLLSELLLKMGYSLSEKVAAATVGGLSVKSVGGGLIFAYLNEHIKPTLEALRHVVSESPARLIILEDAFQGDDELKTNLAQLCKSQNIELWTA